MESVNEKYLKPNSHKGRHRTSVDDDAGGRRKRSIYDNEIPEHLDEDVVPPPQYNVPRTNPEILTRRTNSHRRLTTPSLAPEIPYPATEGRIETEEDGEQRNRKKKHRRRKNHQRNKTLKEHHKNNKGQERKGKGLCSKRTLVIDFADIGWSEWIISPKSFEANVCAGSCPFPRAKNLMASNHATLQSLVRAVGIQEGVPAPCCVPEQLSSLTLLYFDQDKNVVLKNYNGMTVQSCSCR
ncbi:hypothetical protein CAPTEDRAFT_184704 [Capitella teleta]|uniref:TGF-beta family profile domain-containing protein n=1 Tax=Capitella teleta TaxID=283909 RepID=R7VIX0_CAPTE|nr:hypothetical protein CAPTEDRAFT_184704 [Capitella teleta]|eukprot:ELU18783.1 hypothetical protein CAPTEDRAFT_184704 [Capitella teleta]